MFLNIQIDLLILKTYYGQVLLVIIRRGIPPFKILHQSSMEVVLLCLLIHFNGNFSGKFFWVSQLSLGFLTSFVLAENFYTFVEEWRRICPSNRQCQSLYSWKLLVKLGCLCLTGIPSTIWLCRRHQPTLQPGAESLGWRPVLVSEWHESIQWRSRHEYHEVGSCWPSAAQTGFLSAS